MLAIALGGCSRVVDIPPSQIPRLSGHVPGNDPVTVRTIDGRTAEIHGEFKRVRIVAIDDEGEEREIIIRPPFRADGDGAWLHYESPSLSPRNLDLESVKSVQVVQRDADRGFTIAYVICLSALAGYAGGLALQELGRDDRGDNICGLCGPVFGAMILGGISVAIVVPLTKHY